MKTLKSHVAFLMILFTGTTAMSQTLPKTEGGSFSIEPSIYLGIPTGTNGMDSFLKTVCTETENTWLATGGIGFRTGYFPLTRFETYIQITASRGGVFESPRGIHSSVNGWDWFAGVEYYFANVKDIASFSASMAVGNESIDFCYSDFNSHYLNWVMKFGLTVWLTRVGFNLSYTPALAKGDPQNNSGLENIPKFSLNSIGLSVRMKF